MKRQLIAGNWKMNMTPNEARELVNQLVPLVQDAECDIAICPPFVDIHAVADVLCGTNIALGAQNVHWAEKGAFTGEIAAPMLTALGVKYVIIGHSERRQYFGETDETVNLRAKAALSHNLIPIICVGESLTQRESGVTDTLLETQVRGAYNGIALSDAQNTVIAYEPIWAIGTGKTATDVEADRTIGVIRNVFAMLYGEAAAAELRILYGGSMNAKNAHGLKSMPQIDGGLIGGASLKPNDFARVILD